MFVTIYFATICVPLLATGDPARPEVVDVATDPQLFLDDYLVARQEGLVRTMHQPCRRPTPVLPQGPDVPKYLANFHTVIFDPQMKRFRLWYNGGSGTWYSESDDGIAWDKPRCLWNYGDQGKRGFAASVIWDPAERDPARRFKHASWQHLLEKGPGAWRQTGTHVAWSADGLRWTPFEGNPVLHDYNAGPDQLTIYDVFDHTDLFYDPLRRLYTLFVRLRTLPSDNMSLKTRLVGQSTSADFLHWEKPWRIHMPDAKDAPGLEFYGQGGVLARGRLLIGFVRVLHDNLTADTPPDPPRAFGIGYSVLTYSRDGRTWTRCREPFLDRSPEKGRFDHAHAWVNSVLPVGKQMYVYYAGYEQGHKVGLRQIGLATLRRDGYVSLDAGADGGSLQTVPLRHAGSRLLLNAEVDASGELRVEVQNADGVPLPGFAAADCDPLRGDDVEQAVTWKGGTPPPATADRPLRLKFILRSAKLYGFEFR